MSSSVSHKSLKRPDEFVSAVQRFFDDIGKHTRGITVALIALVVLSAAGIFMVSQREAKSESARGALFNAQKTLEKELKAIAAAQAPAAPAKDSAKESKDAKTPPATTPGIETVLYKKLDVDTQLKESVSQLKLVEEKYPSSRAAYEARLTLGNLYRDHGSVAQSEPWYRKALDSAPNAFERTVASLALGHALEDQSKHKDAIQAFEKNLKQAPESLKGEVLLSIARNHEQLHDTAKARSTYDQIISQMPTSEHARTAEALKAQLD